MSKKFIFKPKITNPLSIILFSRKTKSDFGVSRSMEINLRRPFTIVHQARKIALHSKKEKKKTSNKKVKVGDPVSNLEDVSSHIQPSSICSPQYPNLLTNNPCTSAYSTPQKLIEPQENIQEMPLVNGDYDYWPTQKIENKAQYAPQNQSFDTQESLSLSSGYNFEENQKAWVFTQNLAKLSEFKPDKTYEISYFLPTESDDEYWNFMNLDGICSKEIKRFPIPFDKKIINYIEDEEI